MNDAIEPKPAPGRCPSCRLAMIMIAIAILIAAIAFTAGYETSSRRHAQRVVEEGKRQMLEALVNCIRLGIIEVKDDRLRELTANDVGTNEDGNASNPAAVTQ